MHFVWIIQGAIPLGEIFFFAFGDIHPKWYSLVLSSLEPLLNLCFFASLVRWGGGGGRERRQWRIWPPCRRRAVRGPESAAPPPVPPSVPAAVPALPRGTDLWPSLTGLFPPQQNAGKIAPGTPLEQFSPLRPSSAPLPPPPPPAAGNKTLLVASCRHRSWDEASPASNRSSHSRTLLKAQPQGPCLWLGTLLDRVQFSVYRKKERKERPDGIFVRAWTLKSAGPGLECCLSYLPSVSFWEHQTS